MQRVHSKREKYQCDICGAVQTSKMAADHHKLIHTGERPHTCAKCGVSFRSIASLYRHENDVHKALKKYRCETCDKTFSQSCSLKRHINDVHKKIKAFKCEVCGWAFAQKSGLKAHQAAEGGCKGRN